MRFAGKIGNILLTGEDMRIKLMLIALGIVFVIGACNKSEPPGVTLQVPTSVAKAPTAVVVPDPTQIAGPPVPEGCTVVSPRPTAGPTQQSLFPPVSADDWVKGPDSAQVTFIEYSDFQ